MSTTHTCKATGCTRRIKTEYLMCPFHWRLVPKDVQTRVYAAYNEWHDSANADFPAAAISFQRARSAGERLRQIQQEAIDAVADLPERPRTG